MTRHFDLERPIFRKLSIAAAIGCAALIAHLSLASVSELPSVKMSDKINHFIAYASLSVPLVIAMGRGRWLLAIAVATAFGAFMELAQGTFTAHRDADLIDGIANALGACAGVGFGYFLLTRGR